MACSKLFVRLAAITLLAAAATTAQSDKFEISMDPLDMSNEFPHDYRNWAAVLSNVLLKTEGSEDAAAAALQRVMLATHGHLARVANGEDLFPRFHLQDPVLTAGAAAAINGLPPASGTLLKTSQTFFNYAPCVLSESGKGFDGFLTGLNIAPSLIHLRSSLATAMVQGVNLSPKIIFVNPAGVNIQPQGLNVQPALIYIGPIGANVQPQGANIQPALINVAPVGSAVQPQGLVVAPARKSIAPVHVLFSPHKQSYAPVRVDLAKGRDEGDAGALVGATDAGR